MPGERAVCVYEGPQVMKGYYNRPEETTRTFTHDGYHLRTGDVATIDKQGFVTSSITKKDMIWCPASTAILSQRGRGCGRLASG